MGRCRMDPLCNLFGFEEFRERELRNERVDSLDSRLL